jgi:hypothetical protein
MISASLRDPDEGFEELLSELVDAHVDTIELVVRRDGRPKLGRCAEATYGPATLRPAGDGH